MSLVFCLGQCRVNAQYFKSYLQKNEGIQVFREQKFKGIKVFKITKKVIYKIKIKSNYSPPEIEFGELKKTLFQIRHY